LNFGCFFDQDEARFALTALSFEGEPFLDLYQEMNPFERGDFDPKTLGRVSVPDYLRVYCGSQEYRWWCWTWWERYGRVGAFRGNSLERGGRVGWEHPQYRRVHHVSLGAYGLVEGEPRQTTPIPQPDGRPVRYPFAIGRHFDPSFYRDLEQCHVAFLFTYGRTFEGVFQVRRGWEVLVVLLPPSRKLGVDHLRHLFLDGCGAFTFRRGNPALQAHLVKTWIEQAPADGLRTVCGSDGGLGGDRGGWRYFGYYNKGESISDSWAFADLDEYVENCPVTAAFGSTTREALGTLLTGRFTDQRAEAKAVAISVWAGSAVP
jgi:hypothetical protein